jgi:hypothetical protein
MSYPFEHIIAPKVNYPYAVLSASPTSPCNICRTPYVSEPAVCLSPCGHTMGLECYRAWNHHMPDKCPSTGHPWTPAPDGNHGLARALERASQSRWFRTMMSVVLYGQHANVHHYFETFEPRDGWKLAFWFASMLTLRLVVPIWIMKMALKVMMFVDTRHIVSVHLLPAYTLNSCFAKVLCLNVVLATAVVGAVLLLGWWRSIKPGTFEEWGWRGVDRILLRRHRVGNCE